MELCYLGDITPSTKAANDFVVGCFSAFMVISCLQVTVSNTSSTCFALIIIVFFMVCLVNGVLSKTKSL